jgi:H+/gluconate symporter-like permease
MILRKCILALAVAATLSATVNQSKAVPQPAPITYATGAALSTGAAVTIGFIGVVAVICLYDIWLKINGYKNWDGTPKTVQVHHHSH